MNRVYIVGHDEIPREFNLGEGESVELTLVVLPGTSTELPLEFNLNGAGATLDLAGVYLCDETEKVDIEVKVRHNVGGCSSRQCFKGIVGGGAKAKFGGLIYVAPDAQKTKAYQQNHTILLDDSSRVESLPQLEIYADDVECSHGCSSGFLSDEEQFYMRSRGIPETQARRLQKIAFLAPILNRLPEDLADEIYGRIS